MSETEPTPPVLSIDIFPRGRSFDCADCGEPMDQVAYDDEIDGGVRFICETCRPNYVTTTLEVRGE